MEGKLYKQLQIIREPGYDVITTKKWCMLMPKLPTLFSEREIKNGNAKWVGQTIHRSKVPEGATILPAVWQIRQWAIKTETNQNLQARINIWRWSRIKNGFSSLYTSCEMEFDSILVKLWQLATIAHTQNRLCYWLFFKHQSNARIYIRIPRGCWIDEGNTWDFILKIYRNITKSKKVVYGMNTWQTFL
jgi:hypothetical protein